MPKHATSAHTVQAHKLLSEHLVKTGEGMVDYKEGFDDTRIAAMIDKDLSPASVARIRQELFGKLINRGTGADARIAALEGSVRNLCGLIQEMVEKHDKLVDNLAVNKVADVRHLRVNKVVNLPQQKAS